MENQEIDSIIKLEKTILLKVTYLKGPGTPEDIFRNVTEFWTEDSEYVFTVDPVDNN